MSIIGISAQGHKVRVFGYLIDSNNRSIEGANVYFENKNTGTVTNQNGYYDLSMNLSDSATLIFSHLGYQTIKHIIYPKQKVIQITVELPPLVKELKEINVTGIRRQTSTMETLAGKKDSFVVPEDIDVQKVWLLEEGNCLRTQFENICELKENTVKPKNLEFVASNINTLVQLVDKLGGVSILPELAVEQLTDQQKQKVKRFRAPFPYREISVIYYKPTYKQKILDELITFVSDSLKTKLNFNKNPEEFVGVKPQ